MQGFLSWRYVKLFSRIFSCWVKSKVSPVGLCLSCGLLAYVCHLMLHFSWVCGSIYFTRDIIMNIFNHEGPVLASDDLQLLWSSWKRPLSATLTFDVYIGPKGPKVGLYTLEYHIPVLKVHRYSFWKIERVIRICLKFQNLFKDLFWAKWNKKINMSPGFLRFYDVF